jgi:acyl-CoA synthetase (NDP forming)
MTFERLLQAEWLEASDDMPLIGPNCYGLLNYVDGAMLRHRRFSWVAE